ncbi:FAD binding domain-containing protein [Lipingzhangella sp. LS1_29]|uniref:FAD binding domain-containing protein n=1 Tax=Lipingzhangella rawalii TaxID=2055835 RepID=A0ABU2H124_9ACTN|nr:FAD binding domain-containing protein [Lipingzhangella rawalii]MDS1269003.1 FAD binding domain-containing protein [Lipingzhangella rawalii]
MEFFSPPTWEEALEIKSAHPEAVPITGGTDVMVELNFDRRRPSALLDLTRIAELHEISPVAEHVRLGAAVSYTRVAEQLGDSAPALAQAARTVASPQIRNRGSVGGNLGAGSPSGDCHPPLVATDATIELASVRGVRQVPARDFYLGVKRVDLQPDELISAVLLPRPRGPQQFTKLGPRNAMVIAVCSFALSLDREHQQVATGIGSCAPTPIRAAEAEQFVAAEIDWSGERPLPAAVCAEFGRRVAAEATPIDDVRGSAAYRRHALSVMARRALVWAVNDYRGEQKQCA